MSVGSGDYNGVGTHRKRRGREQRYRPGTYDGTEAVQTYPATIFTSEDEYKGKLLQKAVQNFAWAHGIEVMSEDPPQYGSWFRRIWLQTKVAMGSQRAQELLYEMNQSLIAHIREKPAYIDSLRSDSAAALISAVKDQEEAVILLGQLLIVKAGPKMVVLNLSPDLAEKIRIDPTLSKNAQSVLALVSHHGADRGEYAVTTTIGDRDSEAAS